MKRISPIFAGLLTSIVVILLFAPRHVASQAAFYHDAKRAVIAGVVAAFVVRFSLARWQSISGAPGATGQFALRDLGWRPGDSPWKIVLQALVGAMVLALVAAKSMEAGLVKEPTASFLFVAAQQLIIAGSAYYTQQSAMRDESRTVSIKMLIVHCALASLFAVMMPPLFLQIATSKVVPIDPSDLVFAVPAILVSLVGVIRVFRGHNN